MLLFCFATPAYANNPPQPDGLFSILLIFPVVILGRRLAGVVPVSRTLAKKISVPVVLTVCVIVSAAGTELSLIPLLIILAYGIRRGAQILREGHGQKRLFIGAGVIALVLFSVTDYFASLLSYDPGPVRESIAVSHMRSLAAAEMEFKTPNYSKAIPPVYGTMAELEDTKLFEWNLVPGTVQSGYLYGEVIDKPNNQFLFYAVPAFARHAPSRWFYILPGGSLLLGILHRNHPPETGDRSFAVDESGIIRVSPNWKPGAPVSREDAHHWQVLQ